MRSTLARYRRFLADANKTGSVMWKKAQPSIYDNESITSGLSGDPSGQTSGHIKTLRGRFEGVHLTALKDIIRSINKNGRTLKSICSVLVKD
jgi:hypothetical protein